MDFLPTMDRLGRQKLSIDDAELLVHKHFETVVMTKVSPLQWELTYGGRIFYVDLLKSDQLDYLSDFLGEAQQEFLNAHPRLKG